MGRKKRRGGKAPVGRKTRSSARLTGNVIQEDISQSPSESEESGSSGTPKSCNTPIEADKSIQQPATLLQHKKFGKIRCLVDDANKTEISSSESEMQLDQSESETKACEMQVDQSESEMKEGEMPLDQSDSETKACEIGFEQPQSETDVNEMQLDQPESEIKVSDVLLAQPELEIKGSEIVLDQSEFETKVSEMLDPVESKTKENDNVSDADTITEGIKSVDITEGESSQDIPVCSEEILQEEVSIQLTETIMEDNSNCGLLDDVQTPKTHTIEPVTENDDNSNEEKSSDSISKEQTTESDPQSVNTESKETVPETTSDSNASTVRRSSRIRSISVLKQKSKGRGVVRSEKIEKKEKLKKSETENSSDSSNTKENETVSTPLDSPSFATPNSSTNNDLKPVKVKSRWRRSSELEMNTSPLVSTPLVSPQTISETTEGTTDSMDMDKEDMKSFDEDTEEKLRHFQTLTENEYLTERTSCREAKKMLCDCFLVEEEIERGEFGCGDDCLNRLLMIECGSHCVVGDRCTNKRFQKLHYAPCEVFRTRKKGFGIKATANISAGDFILEYVGEVLDQDEFDKRAKEYSKDKNRHYYFMALRSDAVIDATQKGNISRFINHSCEPNAETQKWTVNGELRIGFFSTRSISAGDEITFDYQFQRYGKEAQKCYCEAPTCRGWIGEEPDSDEEGSENDEEEEEEEEPEEEEKEKEDIKEESSEEKENKEPIVKIKREPRKRRYIKKQRKDIFDDLDLDEEIEMLSSTGVKNQTHTLKLSRLMVRAKEMGPRMQLLTLLWQGEEPCRRLFLDYHGLRLIHGWMCDVNSLNEHDNILYKMEILKALDSLPIKNKTILQDSKVLSIVEKWAAKSDVNSPTDSDNSPSDIPNTNETKKEETELKKECPQEDKSEDKKLGNKIEVENMDIDTEDIKLDGNSLEVSEIVEVSVSEPEEKIEEEKEEKITEKDILALCAKLLERWLLLKQDFRIPKKERIKQMKEHEREADRGYKAGLEDTKNVSRYSNRANKYKEEKEIKKKLREKKDHERKSSRKLSRSERNIVPIPHLSKYERRQLFALQVQQEEEGRKRKQQDIWRQHEQRCLMMGQDPRLVPFDPNFPYWNPNMPNNNWQSNFPPNVPPNMMQNMPPNMVPNMPPNMAPMPPNMAPNMPPNQQMYPHIPIMLPQGPNLNPNLKSNVNPPMPHYQSPQPCLPKEEPFVAPLPPPPPVKLPPKWKCARDKYGRPYYYHVKVRISQWEPPEFPPPVEEIQQVESTETSSSSDTSSLSSDSSSDSDEDDLDDTKLLLEIQNKLKAKEIQKAKAAKITEENMLEREESKIVTSIESHIEVPKKEVPKRKRVGLVQEMIISPRSEEDKLLFKVEAKKYKETKEKLKKQKELLLEQTKKKLKAKAKQASKQAAKQAHTAKPIKKHRSTKTTKLKNIGSIDMNSEDAKKIREIFRKTMATVMVQNLNAYRKPDCKVGRITNTEDFKHLARKLTHFVMVKELKHCQRIEDLTCNESVKVKAKDFIRKYMQKFGEVYSKPKDEIDY